MNVNRLLSHTTTIDQKYINLNKQADSTVFYIVDATTTMIITHCIFIQRLTKTIDYNIYMNQFSTILNSQ